jgi:Zn-dependent peptidase ImmA (M78 family)
MKPVVADHPGYPFREEFLQAFSARGLLFVDGPAPGSPEHGLLDEFLGLVHAYAFMERLVQGEILCELLVHIDRVLAGCLDPQDEGERLASQEAGLLDWTPESADSLVDALDEIGVKVICRDDPDDGPALAGPRLGAFTFDGDAGPAFLVGASPHTPEAAFIAAHELGHLTADIDPYLPRLCRWDAKSFTNLSDRPEEVRADRFARALLMPRETFVDAVRDLGECPTEGADPRAEQLAAMFGVPWPMAIQRLVDLGLPAVGAAESIAGPTEELAAATAEVTESGMETAGAEMSVVRSTGQATRESAGPRAKSMGLQAEESVGQPDGELEGLPTEEPPVSLTLPERFVNLALAAYAGHVLDVDGLARFLRITPPEALQMADIAGVRPEWRDGSE